MYQFNLYVDPDVVEDLCLNENTVFESYYEDGKVIVRVLDEKSRQEFETNPCDMCPFYCKTKGICIANI